MKVTTHDLLAILRRFDIAGDEHVPRNIDQVKQSHPSPINQLVAFRFGRDHYYALVDETAEDRAGYIMDELRKFNSNVEGEILENPTSELTTYGLPFKGKDIYLFRLTTGKKRLDVRIAEEYPETSRSTWQKHIRAGHISVNNSVVLSPKTEVGEADSISISVPDGSDFSEHDLPIIYIDANVIVVNKPEGVLTHSKGEINDEFTVADFFRRYTSVGLNTNRPGIVHRLDRDTSGVIIGARTPESFEILKKQFSERRAKKQYIALLSHIPKQTAARIDIPIGRNPSSPSTFRADSKGKSAITDYTVLGTSGKEALVSLSPQTGRTHQLRVHLAHIGCAIVGDRVYGKLDERLFLHAASLEVTIAPEQRMTFTAPLPSAFEKRFPGASTVC